MEDFTLLMRFVDESPSFVHGYECGRMWEWFDRHMEFDNYLFHTANTEQIRMMCIRFHYTCRIDYIDETWSNLVAKLNPESAN